MTHYQQGKKVTRVHTVEVGSNGDDLLDTDCNDEKWSPILIQRYLG